MAHKRRQVAIVVVAMALCVALFAPRPGIGAATAASASSVSNVTVDVTSTDATTARAKALAIGQRNALERLLRRLVPTIDHNRLPTPDDVAITDLVKSFEVSEEKVSAVRYTASLIFHFNDRSVGQLLRDHGIAYAATPLRRIVILPLYQDEGGAILWEDGNVWREAWTDLPASDGLVRMVVPLGELADLMLVDASRADRGDRAAFAELAERYGADEVAVAAAEVVLDVQRNAPMIRVTLRRFQSEGVRIGGGTYSGMDWEALDAILATAALETRTQVDDEWKAANLLRFDREDSLLADIPIGSFRDWLEIRAKLEELALVRRVEIVALSAVAARVTIDFLGDLRQLSGALASSGLELRQGIGIWRLERGGGVLPNAEVPAEVTDISDGPAVE